MARKSPGGPDLTQKQWSDQEVQRFESDVSLALNHAHGRNNRVAQVLCYLSLMRAAGRISNTSGVMTVTKAEFQNYHGPAGTQAAHYLPGQLRIGRKRVSEYISDRMTRLRLDGLFGDVHTLPPNFNKADSEAEKNGLCDAFAAACREVIHSGSAPRAGSIDRPGVQQAYESVWVPLARSAFQRATTNKGTKYTAPALRFGAAGTADYKTILNLPEREAANEYERNIEEQRRILGRYTESLSTPLWKLLGADVLELQTSFRP
jgi:hypothetical protein